MKNPNLPNNADRLPPHSHEAEQGVLGCMMLSPVPCIAEAVGLLKVGGEAFYDLRHGMIFDAMTSMQDSGQPVDIITLQQHLKDTRPLDERGRPKEGNLLDMVGGIGYVASLPDAVPSTANLSYYANIVYEKHLLRRLIQTCTGVIGRVYDCEGEVDALMDEVERDILSVSSERALGEAARDAKALVNLATNKIEALHANQGASGLATGFKDFDGITHGLHDGEMIVIAARPSMGKTSLAMNIADHVACELHQPVGVFSLEMTAESLMVRMMCSRARVNLHSINNGFMAERDFPKLTSAAGTLSASKLFIDDTAGLSILQLRAKARRMTQQFGLRLIVVDYLQLMHSTAARSRENRNQEVSDICNGLKAMAKELRLPVLVLSQLNREVEKRGTAEPRLSDLRESGSIEQDADLVGLLYRTDSKESDSDNEAQAETWPVKLYIAKQRNGPTGEIKLTFLRSFTKFESAAKIDQEDVPQTREPYADR